MFGYRELVAHTYIYKAENLKIVENIHLVCLLGLTTDFGITPIHWVTHQKAADRKSKT